MSKKLVRSVVLLTAAISAVNGQATNAAARYLAGCGLLKGNVYCFGGSRGNFSTDTSTDATMYMLDLSQSATMAQLANNWTLIQPNTNGVTVDSRKCPQVAQITDSEIIYSGGYGSSANDNPILDQTIAYSAETNSWSKYPNYVEAPYGNRQIYFGASSFVPGQGAAFYGGFEQHINQSWTITTTQNTTATTFGGSRVIGYTELTFLNINQSTVWNVPTQVSAPSVFSAFQTSVYSPTDDRIYFFGGTYQDTTQPGYVPDTFDNWHPFTYTLYYNLKTNSWGNQTLGGNVIPTNRRWHTVTLMPNNQTQLLLYGGENADQVVNDYCFTLDLTTFKWTQVSFPVITDGSDLLRSRHSDLLIDNDTLLLVFGMNSAAQSTSRPLQFNISSTSNITYMSQFVASSSPTDTPSASSGLSSGAIAGIVVAIVVIILIAAVVAFFCIRKKKKARKVAQRRQAEETEQKLQSSNNSQEPMEVNWDEIERQYTEIPQPATAESVSHKPNVVSNEMDDTTTFVVSQSSGSVGGHKQYAPNVAQIPDEGGRTPYLIMKPDGGQ